MDDFLGSMSADPTSDKGYCDDIQKHTNAFSETDLLECYRNHINDSPQDLLWYGRRLCNYHFPIDSEDEDSNQANAKEYLYCLSDNNVPRGEDWCDLTYSEDEMSDRIDCYDLYNVKSIKACDAKQQQLSQSNEEV